MKCWTTRLSSFRHDYPQLAADFERGGLESEQVLAFMQRFLGTDQVTVANALRVDPVNGDAPAPVPAGNLDNR